MKNNPVRRIEIFDFLKIVIVLKNFSTTVSDDRDSLRSLGHENGSRKGSIGQWR